MDKRIEKIRNFRLFLLKQLEGLTAEQLNQVPSGYNNNIIWNVAHLICAEQSMCYVRAGLPLGVDDKYFSPYLPTTKPTSFVDAQEVAIIKGLLLDSVDRLHADFEKKMFGNYSPSAMTPKVYGVEVNNIDDALEFLLYHEGFHSGYVVALKRAVLAGA